MICLSKVSACRVVCLLSDLSLDFFLSSSDRILLPFVIRSMQYVAVNAEMSSNEMSVSLDFELFRISRTAS